MDQPGPLAAGMLAVLAPSAVFGVLAGTLVLGEALGARAVLATAVTFTGVVTCAAGSQEQLYANVPKSGNGPLQEPPRILLTLRRDPGRRGARSPSADRGSGRPHRIPPR